MTRRCISVVAGMVLIVSFGVTHAQAANDIVLYATAFATVQGNWAIGSSGSGAGGQRLASVDYGRSPTSTALSSPADYVEATFPAPAATAYHVWLRLRASSDSKYNDSVSVQFSDAIDANGSRIHAIGSTAGLVVNLATDASGGSLAGWGWQDGAYWLQQTNIIRFSGSGSHTIRIQTREDGVQVDQVVLSPATYFSSAPGQVTNDATIVASASSTTTAATSSAYSGVAAALPRQVNAETFDNGGEGVGYHDTSGGNNGGQARSTDVDIEASSDGGYDVGWTTAGEWLNYTVNPTAGAYTLQVRVASPNGGAIHVGFNGASNVWTAVTVPATGGWQTWTNVAVPVTLASGPQQMTIMFDTGGVNFRYLNAVAATTITAPAPTPSPSNAGAYKPLSIPGKLEAEDFDNGGEGVAYHDTGSGNNGGVYRATDVDIESASEGGYDLGWTAAGEWLNYTVNVAAAGAYTAQMRVASPNGGQLHIGFSGPSGVWTSVTVPPTGGWQSWASVNVPVTLGAGAQQMTVLFDTAGVNFNYVNVVSGSPSVTTAPPSSTGSELIVAEWNIQVDDSSAGHARAVIDTLTSFSPRPQVIVLTEAHGSQYNTYINELNNNTGLSWHGVFQPHCPPGAWNGSSCTATEDEGVAVFSALSNQGSSAGLLPYADAWHSARAWVRLAVGVSGVTTHVFGTHLQVSNMAARVASMELLKYLTTNFSGPKFAAGDFNADPDQIDTTAGMRPNFIDSWGLLNSTRGFTFPAPNPTLKLDYWFLDQSGRITPNWSSVVTWTGTISDHFPVHASFTIR